MIAPTRLFDLLEFQQEKFNLNKMLSGKVNGNWVSYSTTQAIEMSNALSAGLLSLGITGNDFTVENADKVAIISNNRPEWVFTDMACQQIGAVLTPIYPTTSNNEIEFIFNDAEVKVCFVSNKDLYEKIKSLQPNIPTLQYIFSFNEIEGIPNWKTLLEAATDEQLKNVEFIKQRIDPSSVATIIYTSGTTGFPKGVMLSHRNILSNALLSIKSFPFEDANGGKVLSFLPLNHIFERMVSYIYIHNGYSIWYAESMETIADNLKEVKPNGFTTVPRLLEKVYESIVNKGHALTGIKKQLFFWALKLGLQYDNINRGSWWYRLQLAIANKLVFSKWREGLGGNIEFIISGGAACQERLLRIFNSARIPVFEGYGPTENSPVISVNCNIPGGTKYGTVGLPILGQEVKLAEDGEILVKGPSVMVGYYKRPDLTAEVVKEGWLLTGDIGCWVDDRFLKITDRKKELFKTSGGKYVAPQPIENKFKENRYIEQIMVVGAGEKFVSALIVPSFVNLKAYLEEQGETYTSNEAAINNPKVKALIDGVVDGFNAKINHVEQVKRYQLLPKEWSIDGGEMTPKLSLKRKVIMEKYKDYLDKIYTGADKV
ncbi:AMP-dependent synthetase/ligase [Polluticaenibacter yanchengensis]|uniref:Long-chain fatty acid--CoA ligase n=1 Tax=Polluticaenibacter yanchengensis TaxID=3014562 RepID=A0ABT4UML9_9BACT|nr:long-chain fatty acid--CoA ligase [Chitinophagaceae bacterium LY-5]